MSGETFSDTLERLKYEMGSVAKAVEEEFGGESWMVTRKQPFYDFPAAKVNYWPTLSEFVADNSAALVIDEVPIPVVVQEFTLIDNLIDVHLWAERLQKATATSCSNFYAQKARKQEIFGTIKDLVKSFVDRVNSCSFEGEARVIDAEICDNGVILYLEINGKENSLLIPEQQWISGSSSCEVFVKYLRLLCKEVLKFIGGAP